MEKALKILLLEDFPADAELIIRELKKGNINFNTLVVGNKNDFVNALNEYFPDIILSDHSLPSFNSTEALKILRESGLNIPFILVTATVSEEFAVEVLKKEGADDYILKNNLTRLPSSVMQTIKRHNSQVAEEKAKQELQDAHTKLLFHLENSPLGYIEWEGPGLHVKYMSKQAEKIFGITEKQFRESGRTGHLHVYEDDMPYAQKKLEELLSGKIKNNTAQHRNYKKDGTVIWCEWFNSALKDKDGTVITIMSLVQDITIRKKNENEILISEERYRRIVETSQEGIWTIDENNNTNFVNKKLCEILEYSPEEMIGKTLYYFMDENGKKLANEVLESQKKKHIDSYEFKFTAKSGIEVWANIATNAIFGENKKYLGALAMVTDITERKHSEQETLNMVKSLQSKNKDLRQFAYMMSHNLRAPITKIQGLSMLFDTSPKDEAFNRSLVKIITNEAVNLDNVVKDMNTIITARDSGKEANEFVLFEKKVNQINLVLEKEINESKAEITFDFSKVPGIKTVKSYLYSIIFNLISNSIKYRRQDISLKINLETSLVDNFICLKVSDNGTGINLKKYGDKLFGLYKRFHGTEIPGKGIGLSLIKSQAESLGGHVKVESEVNKGTTFIIFFPE